jgi:hypothetical protein
LTPVVGAYGSPYRIEVDWSRRKGRWSLQDEGHIQGLVYLLVFPPFW